MRNFNPLGHLGCCSTHLGTPMFYAMSATALDAPLPMLRAKAAAGCPMRLRSAARSVARPDDLMLWRCPKLIKEPY